MIPPPMELGTYNVHGNWLPFNWDDSFLIVGTNRKEKTELIVRLALDHLQENPIVFLDSNGNAIEEILNHFPKSKSKNAIYFDASNRDHSFKLNFLHGIPREKHAQYASKLLEAIKAPSQYTIATATLDHYILYGIAALLDAGGYTLTDLPRFFTNRSFRTSVLVQVKDTFIRYVWDTFDALFPRDKSAEIRSSFTKLAALNLDPLVRDSLSQRKNRLRFKDKIVLISLPEKKLGKENTAMLGSLILAQLAIEDPDTTLFIDGADLFSNIPDIPHVLTLKDFKDIPTGSHIVLKTSVKDADRMEPLFVLDDRHLRFFEIPEGMAYAGIAGQTIELQLYPHHYPLTNGVREKIIERCVIQYTKGRT